MSPVVSSDQLPRPTNSGHPMSLSEYLVRQILESIKNDHLVSGDRLPSMKSLAQRFNVAVPTLREAMRRLEANGVLEIRHGAGVYVKNGADRIVVANSVHIDHTDARTVLDLLEARLLIEPHLSDLAARSISDAALEDMRKDLDEAEQNLNDDSRLHELNMKFHCSAARAAGNAVLSQTIEAYLDLYSFEQKSVLSFYDSEGRPSDQAEHKAIWAALKAKDGPLARQLMFDHLHGVKETVRQHTTSSDR